VLFFRFAAGRGAIPVFAGGYPHVFLEYLYKVVLAVKSHLEAGFLGTEILDKQPLCRLYPFFRD
jgi:hypothetical protein